MNPAAVSPGAHAESLAYMKAMASIKSHGLKDGLVLAADTIVELAGRIIGKPDDEADARRILSQLSGSQHRVITGLALVDVAAGRRLLAHEVTGIRMRRMSPEEIDAYVAGGEAMGKAGRAKVARDFTWENFTKRFEEKAREVVDLHNR